jgi:predicted transcriptional regulator
MQYNANMLKENFTFRFDPDFISRVDAQAKAERRSRTNMLEVMGEDYLKRLEEEKAEKK